MTQGQGLLLCIVGYTLFFECFAHENHSSEVSRSPILSSGIFGMGYFAYWCKDHITELTWPKVRVSDSGPPGELGKINVHLFWRRVYWKGSIMYLLHCKSTAVMSFSHVRVSKSVGVSHSTSPAKTHTIMWTVRMLSGSTGRPGVS